MKASKNSPLLSPENWERRLFIFHPPLRFNLPSSFAQSPWKALEEEEEYLAQDEYAGLGFRKFSQGPSPGWYGGKVAFRARVNRKTAGESFQLTLENIELGPSSNCTRRFGSKNFIRVKVPKNLWKSSSRELLEFFAKPFLIADYVYRAFFARDQIVFLLRTDETLFEDYPPRSSVGINFVTFWEICNPLRLNTDQVGILP